MRRLFCISGIHERDMNHYSHQAIKKPFAEGEWLKYFDEGFYASLEPLSEGVLSVSPDGVSIGVG
jgi:hypothetical protein